MSSLSKLQPYALALGSFAAGILINLELNLKVFAKAHTDEQVTFNGEFSTTIRGPVAYHFSRKPSLFSCHPVGNHVHVTLTGTEDLHPSSYRVVALGSSATGTESLSSKAGVYDSVKGKWEPAGDVPEAYFSPNDHQTGVYLKSENVLLCVGFMMNGSKGILAFDVEKRQWRECAFFLQHPVEDTASSAHFQLVECGGEVSILSEQEAGGNGTHCIDRLELVGGGAGFAWERKVTRQRQGCRDLLVFPEYTRVPLGV